MADINIKTHTAFMFGLTCDQLTPDQSNHVTEIAKEFSLQMAQKYVRGQVEHGGNLWDLSEDQLLDNAIEEATDQVVYLLTLRRKRREHHGNKDGNG